MFWNTRAICVLNCQKTSRSSNNKLQNNGKLSHNISVSEGHTASLEMLPRTVNSLPNEASSLALKQLHFINVFLYWDIIWCFINSTNDSSLILSGIQNKCTHLFSASLSSLNFFLCDIFSRPLHKPINLRSLYPQIL